MSNTLNVELTNVIRENNLEKVKELIEIGADPTSFSYNSIRWSVSVNNDEMTEYLFNEIKKVEKLDEKFKIWIVSYWIRRGNRRLVEQILTYKINFAADGINLLKLAISKNDYGLVEILVKAGAMINEETMYDALEVNLNLAIAMIENSPSYPVNSLKNYLGIERNMPIPNREDLIDILKLKCIHDS